MSNTNTTQSCYIINKSRQFIPGEKILKQPGDNYVLRNKTADVLLLLLQTPGQVVPTRTFFDVVWRGKYVSENVLKQSISELRSCLCDEHKKLIVTLPKAGYMLQCSVEVISLENIDLVAEDLPQPADDLRIVEPDVPAPGIAAISAENDTVDKAPPADSTFKIMRYVVATGLLVASGLFLNSYVLAQQAVVTDMKNRNSELKAGLALYLELHTMSDQNAIRKQEDTKAVLDEKLHKLLDSQRLDPTYLGQMDALKELYAAKGYFREALLIASRLEHGVKLHYGQHSEKLIRTKLKTVNILLELQRSEEALRLGNDLLKEVREYFPYDRKLLAEVNFLVSRSNSYCIDFDCTSETIL